MFRNFQGAVPPVADIAIAITATAGGGQTNAKALTAALNRVDTVATIADSVKLPAALPGLCIYVKNNAANSMQVFGQATETINGVASATGVALAGGKAGLYTCVEAGKWDLILSA